MRVYTALFAVLILPVAAPARQAPSPVTADSLPIDPTQVPAFTGEIAQRSEHLKPMFDQIHVADWIAKGAPQAYSAQWKSLLEQNQAIQDDMSAVAQHPAAMQDIMKALFRIHRFDTDLSDMLGAIRRYQNPALADLIGSVAAGDRNGVENLQRYVLSLADATEKRLSLEDEEAQRCRSELASQPAARSVAPKSAASHKTTQPTSK